MILRVLMKFPRSYIRVSATLAHPSRLTSGPGRISRRNTWLGVGLMLPGVAMAQSRGTLIAAAADLQQILPEIIARFHAAGGGTVTPSFGSSGNFARQLRQGAPFEMFLSADETYVVDLERDGFTRGEAATYAIGRLALLVSHSASLALDPTLEDLRAALADGRVTRFAIANPRHAPYGQRAEEVLRHRGLWPAIERHLVLGDHVAQAAQFVASGNAEAGLIASAIAASPRVAALARYAVIDATWHTPLRQRMALMRGAGPNAERFFAFLRSSAATEILQRNGFELP
jgi:molybdate transport system substrate-binding protein